MICRNFSSLINQVVRFLLAFPVHKYILSLFLSFETIKIVPSFIVLSLLSDMLRNIEIAYHFWKR